MGLPPPSPTRRTHRPIPIQSFRQSYEAKSAHAHQAFFQEFEVRPLPPSGSEQRGPGASRSGWPRPAVWGGSSQRCTPTRIPLLGPVRFSSWHLLPNLQELKEVGKEQPRLEAEHPANAAKNRYPHVLPCEHWGQGGGRGQGGCVSTGRRALDAQLFSLQMTTPGSG